MLRLFRKTPPLDENTLVDMLIQVYAGERTAGKKMLDYIERKATTEQEKRELLAAIESSQEVAYVDTLFDGFRRQLFGSSKRNCLLTHLELAVCFLFNTNKYYPEAVMDILWIDENELRQTVASLEAKLTSCGCRLPLGYVKQQPAVHSFFEQVGK